MFVVRYFDVSVFLKAVYSHLVLGEFYFLLVCFPFVSFYRGSKPAQSKTRPIKLLLPLDKTIFKQIV